MISLTLAALITLLQGCAPHPPLPVAEISGRAAVVSADTLEVRGVRIRLAGIAGPGLDQTCEPQGAPKRCGGQAAQQLRDAVEGEVVFCDRLNVSAGAVKVGRCWLTIPTTPSAPDLDLSRFMVRSGWAWTTPESEYVPDEEYSQRNRLGLWSDLKPAEGLVR